MSYRALCALGACDPAKEWYKNYKEAWAACQNIKWKLWLLKTYPTWEK